MAIYRKMYAKILGKEKKGISKLRFASGIFFFFLGLIEQVVTIVGGLGE